MHKSDDNTRLESAQNTLNVTSVSLINIYFPDIISFAVRPLSLPASGGGGRWSLNSPPRSIICESFLHQLRHLHKCHMQSHTHRERHTHTDIGARKYKQLVSMCASGCLRLPPFPLPPPPRCRPKPSWQLLATFNEL